MSDLIERLLRRTFRPTRDMVQAFNEQGNLTEGDSRLHAEAAAEIERLRTENAHLKTVMVAAAEEIHAHWEAHCDVEGYGPANLTRRLEEGIPSEYAYTAGDFERLRKRLEEAEADARRLREVLPRLIAGIDHLAEIARLWEPDHSSGADRRGWLLAKDAADDARAALSTEPTEEKR